MSILIGIEFLVGCILSRLIDLYLKLEGITIEKSDLATLRTRDSL